MRDYFDYILLRTNTTKKWRTNVRHDAFYSLVSALFTARLQ